MERWEVHHIAKKNRLRRLSAKQDEKCYYCQERTWLPDPTGKRYPWQLRRTRATLEHLIPRAQGGKNNQANTVMACSDCNNRRGSRYTAEEFMELVRSGYLKKIEKDNAIDKNRRDLERRKKSEHRHQKWLADGCPNYKKKDYGIGDQPLRDTQTY